MTEEIGGRKYIDKGLRLRLRIYCIILLVLFTIMLVNIVSGVSLFHLAIGGLLLGGIIGLLAGRIYRLSQDEDVEKIVFQLDWIGGSILVSYIIFGFFQPGVSVAALTVPIVGGIMLGRLFGIGEKVSRMFREQRVFEK